MAQEVQTTLDYRAELNEIEWIWYQQRKVSDKMQVRDKFSNWWDGNTPNMYVWYDQRYKPTSWTVNSTEWGVTYKVKGGDIIVPLAWAYIAEITPWQTWTTTTYYYTIQIWVNGKSRFSMRINYAYHSPTSTILNLGRGDVVTMALKADGVTTNDTFGLRLLKL